jgi:hypothetical protein
MAGSVSTVVRRKNSTEVTADGRDLRGRTFAVARPPAGRPEVEVPGGACPVPERTTMMRPRAGSFLLTFLVLAGAAALAAALAL